MDIEQKVKLKTGEELWLMLDDGNTDLKAMLHALFGEEIHFPQVTRYPTKVDYDQIRAQYKNKSAEFESSAVFELEGIGGVVVGRHAAMTGEGIRFTGTDKYEIERIGVHAVAALLQLYPHSHDNVRIVVTHPVDVSAENMERLTNSLKQTFKVTLPNGTKITYRVRQVIPIEEPVACVQSFILTTEGEPYTNGQFRILPDQQFLVFDMGGAFSQFVPVYVNSDGGLSVNVVGAPVYPRGIQNVMEVFERQLRAAFPELKSLTKIPERMMARALATGQIIISAGEPQDCSKQIDEAMQIVALPTSADYRGRYAGGVDMDCIVMGGGGGGIAHDYFSRKVFNHPYIFTAEKDERNQRYAGVRGASKGLIPALALRKKNKSKKGISHADQ
jgi:hypothetical protein